MEELKKVMDWSVTNVFLPSIFAGELRRDYIIIMESPNTGLIKSCSGFPHVVTEKYHKLFRGFDDVFYVPQSRYTEIRREDVEGKRP